MPSLSPDTTARYATFATVGALGLTQDLTHTMLRSLGDIEGADPELIAEETLCLVATATARAVAVALSKRTDDASLPDALLALPYTYRDYLLGLSMMEAPDAPGDANATDAIHARLERKLSFYRTHLPDGRFPGPRALSDKMELWMGRISPPGLPESPQERLASLDLVPPVVRHLKLVLAYGRQPEASTT
ncbi:hypothetical protein [Salisaeta longa]|uniref:hypothetical protein n=1 Tax=Salisaeta longa TaxID=503170 RepID=UPI0003B46351|nr:hypothetical protein [Salisaeta longa]